MAIPQCASRIIASNVVNHTESRDLTHKVHCEMDALCSFMWVMRILRPSHVNTRRDHAPSVAALRRTSRSLPPAILCTHDVVHEMILSVAP